jgi:hypothetical protein
VPGWPPTYSKKCTFFFVSDPTQSSSFVNGTVFADRGVLWKVRPNLVNFFPKSAYLMIKINSKDIHFYENVCLYWKTYGWIKFSTLNISIFPRYMHFFRNVKNTHFDKCSVASPYSDGSTFFFISHPVQSSSIPNHFISVSCGVYWQVGVGGVYMCPKSAYITTKINSKRIHFYEDPH